MQSSQVLRSYSQLGDVMPGALISSNSHTQPLCLALWQARSVFGTTLARHDLPCSSVCLAWLESFVQAPSGSDRL